MDKAAKYIIEAHPTPCHIPEAMYIGLNHPGLIMKLILYPNASTSLLTIPVDGDKNIVIILTTTTVEIKWGIYVTV